MELMIIMIELHQLTKHVLQALARGALDPNFSDSDAAFSFHPWSEKMFERRV